jgi:hypothetical protein
MAKKLEKRIEGSDVIISVLGIEEPLVFNTGDLPQEIQNRLVPFGAGHKLGDSAASAKTPEESVEAIQKVWAGMLEGKWSTRTAAVPSEKAPKLTKSAILANLEKLPEDQREAAKAFLATLGFTV